MSAEYYTYFDPHTRVTLNPSPLQGVEGRIVTFSGPSGAGKTTITEALHTPGKHETIGKLTTREPRRGNRRERHVYPEVINAAKQDGNFLFWELYGETQHLLPLTPLLNLLDAQTTVMIEAPTIAARSLKEHLPDLVTTVFVDVPNSAKTLARRMKARGDRDDTIMKRIADLPYIYRRRSEYDIIVLNPDAHDEPLPALQTIHSILESI